MNNVSGNASSWLNNTQNNTQDNVLDSEEYKVNESTNTVSNELKPLIAELFDINLKLKHLYVKYPKKELSDALVNMQLSLNSLNQLS